MEAKSDGSGPGIRTWAPVNKKRLKKYLGWEVADLVLEPENRGEGVGLVHSLGLVLRKPGSPASVTLWVQSDPEGTGPGYLLAQNTGVTNDLG